MYDDSYQRSESKPNKKMLMFGGAAVLASVGGLAMYSMGSNTGVQSAPANGIKPFLEAGTNMQSQYHSDMFRVGLKFENAIYTGTENQNDWHIVRLTSDDLNTFTWTNLAGVSWTLTVAEVDWRGQPTVFDVGDDCPYYADGYTRARVRYDDETGSLKKIKGPGGEWYRYVIAYNTESRIAMPSNWQVGLRYECTQYIGTDNVNDWHFVTISNPSGDGEHFEWTNRAGVSWSMAPQYANGIMGFDVGSDCPYYDGDANYNYAEMVYNNNRGRENIYHRGIYGPWGEFYAHVISWTPQ